MNSSEKKKLYIWIVFRRTVTSDNKMSLKNVQPKTILNTVDELEKADSSLKNLLVRRSIDVSWFLEEQ